MSRWPGRLITKTPATPSGPAPTSSAPGIWTLPEVAYWNRQGLWPSAGADPYWSYVSYLLGTTATNAQQNNTFLDSSTNNFTITRAGNTTQGALTPYDPLWSNYFDGSGDYLTSSGGTASTVGSGDFSVEAFVFWTSYPTQYTSIFSTRSTYNANPAAFTVGVESSGYVYAFSNAFIAQTSSGVFALNTWNHVVFTRSGTTARLFVNGVLRATGTNSQNFSDQGFAVGANRDGTEPGAGYVSNVRLVKGSIPTDYQTSSTTVGTTIFTPPTAPLTAISGTGILTCQSNRFIDNSGNSLTITANGNTAVSSFSPFVLAPPGYNTTDNGGSGYFDGNDYLSIPNNAAFQFGTGDFTVECWVNKPAAANGSILDVRSGGTGAVPWAFYIDGSNFPYFYDGTVYTSSVATVSNAWNHIAVVRTSGVLKIFVNGVQGYSAAYTASLNATGSLLVGGTAAYTTGYISNLRIVKGTAVYTAAFTPPTAPVTAIANTSLLLNFTNAGIFDASMNNDMETVGNAQVSSAQAKYGTTSAYFDGTGDYLVLPDNASLRMGSSSFTLEFWWYPSSLTGYQTPFDKGYTGSGALLLQTGNGDGKIIVYASGSGVITASTAVTANTWSHVALVRNGTSMVLYVNGTSVGSATNSTDFNNTGGVGVGGNVGGATGAYPINGYLDDFRITKGYARYTANFTPPTAAFPVY